MKKKLFFTLSILLLLIISIISFNYSQEINPDTGQLEQIEQIQNIGENLNDKEIESDYLKQEWGKILNKDEFWSTKIQPVIDKYNTISPYIDPFFRIIIGVSPSLSWLFVLTFVLWLFCVINFYRIFKFKNKLINYLLVIGFMAILSVSQILVKFSVFILDFLSIFKLWLVQLIVVNIIIIILVLGIFLFKDIKKIFTKKSQEQQDEINRMKLESGAEVAQELAKGLSS
jgi:hypothetical protein